MDNTKEIQKVFVVKISHSGGMISSYPVLRWVVVGINNELAAMKVVLRNTSFIKPPYYDTVHVRELGNLESSSVIGVYRLK